MVDAAISRIPDIREYDLSQTARDAYTLKIVVGSNEKAAAEQAHAELEALYGRGKFTVECMEDLMPGPAGKYRRTHAEFAFDEWALTEGDYIVNKNI